MGNRLKNGRVYKATTKTNLVVYGHQHTASDMFELDGRIHRFGLSFSIIIHANSTVLFYEVDEKVYMSCPPIESIKGKVLVDITEEFGRLKDVCEMFEEEAYVFDPVSFNLFQVEELCIQPVIKNITTIEGNITVYDLHFPNDEPEDWDDEGYEDPNPVIQEVDHLIVISPMDGSPRYFHLSFLDCEYSGGGYTSEVTETEELEHLLSHKGNMVLETTGTFIEKVAVTYNISAIKDAEGTFLLSVHTEGRGGMYLDAEDCAFQFHPDNVENFFQKFGLL